jgi:hypothetical protein
MLCIDIIHLIVSYSKPLDVLNIRLLCKDYIQNINYKSIENLFIEKINTVSGFEIDHIFAKNLLTIIKKYKELTISGSIILQILNQENYENSDIDIYCNIKNRGDKAYEELIRYLNKFETLDEVEGFHPTYTIHHWHVKHIRNMNKKIIDIVIMPMSALDKVNNLKELSFCNNYYDGNTLFLSNYNDIINKTGFLEYSISMDKFLDYDYLNDTKLSGFIVRLDKYNKRGFKIKINKDFFKYASNTSLIKANPVFIYGRKLPLWQAISPGKIRDNMKIHLNNINKKMMDYIEFNKNKIKDMFLQEAKKEQYTLIKQSYAIYDYSRLSFSQYYQYNCGIHRYDCYNCKETPNKDRSGFSRACVTTENKLSAVEHTEESMGTLKYIWDNNIDADGFYQISFMQKDKDDIIMQTSSRKIRSGCMQENKDNDHDIIIPNIGWKWGTPIYWCIKCIPWVRYVSEYGQTQEYHECSCPKTI